MEFTPGPWKYEKVLGSPYRFVIMDAAENCYLADVYWGGGMNSKTTPRSTPEANARLIATSPVLVEALESAQSVLSHDAADPKFCRTKCVRCKIDAALKVVRGER